MQFGLNFITNLELMTALPKRLQQLQKLALLVDSLVYQKDLLGLGLVSLEAVVQEAQGCDLVQGILQLTLP